MTGWAPPPLTPRLATWRHLPLVGRRRELQAVEEVWGEVLQGRRQVLLVGGEPGAGKTRLAAEVAGALHDDDVAVLVGSCSADAGVPYQPFAEMLDQLFGTTPPGALAPVLDEGARELRRLTTGVARHRPDLAEVGAGHGELRRDLFDAVARLLTSLSADRTLAVVLDDVHWAQAPTLALLEHVLQACTATRLLVLATFRTTAPDRSEELAARLADLHRLEGVRRLDLGGLDTEAIAEFVSLRSGLPLHEARPAAALLRDRTGGNPFFLRELWGELQRHGGVGALRSPGQVPASIGDALAARLAGLEHHVRSVIELAAVLGDTFGLATLLAAGEVDRDLTIAGVDSACDLGLIELIDPGSSRYSFIHALTRQAVTDRMPHARRMVLNVRAAQALEDRIDAGTADEGAVLYHRFLVNAAKYACSLAATGAVRQGIEVLGGNGTIEEFSVLPRLYRDSIVYESWEGTHNVLVAQVLADLRRLPILDVVADRLGQLCRSAGSAAGVRARAHLDGGLEEARRAMEDPDHGARFFRHTLDRLMVVARAAYLFDAGEELAAEHLLAAPLPDADAAMAARVDALAGAQ